MDKAVHGAILIKYLLIVSGCIFLFLGIIGIFVPLLPTTPFLLLAASCFFKSSEKLYRWLTGHKVLGRPIIYYRQFNAISLRTKVFSITLLWITIGYSVFYFSFSPVLRVLLAVIAIGVTIHILKLRTLTKEMMENTH